MIQRKHHICGREGFTSYARKGVVYLDPPAPPKLKPITHPERLTLITCVAHGNWLRWLVYRFMAPSPRRRRILDHI